MTTPLFQFLLAALLSWLLTAGILPYLRKQLLDTPNERSSHKQPTPRGGGIAFVLVGTLLHTIFNFGSSAWIPIACLPLAFVGIIDDRHNLPAIYRYIFQLITAVAILLLAKISVPIWFFPFAVIAISALINFMNFMDGMDGLLAGSSVLLMMTVSTWAISGAIFGFLLWNWSPAKVFMGDVGSTFIGAIFVGFALQKNSTVASLSILLIGFPLYADACICVIRRYLSGKNIFSAHRQHLYQRLHQAGWRHSQVSAMYIFSIVLLMICKFLGGWQLVLIGIFIEFCLAIYLDSKIAIRFEQS